jgi:hypothetical protein
MPVVSNTSPIWNLASIERLDLLHDQFSELLIPDEVWQELQVGHEYPELARIQRAIDAKWILIKSQTNLHLYQSLMLKLDSGESAAISLALELGAKQILIDETDGRNTAKAMGLHPIGVLGVLLHAKNSGKIVSVSQDVMRLRHEAGFFIAESLFQRVCAMAGESVIR